MKRKSGDLLRRRVMSSRMGIVSTHLEVFVNAGYKELTTVTVCQCGIQRSCGQGIFRHGDEPHGGAGVATDNHTEYYRISTVCVQLNLEVIEAEGDSKRAAQATISLDTLQQPQRMSCAISHSRFFSPYETPAGVAPCGGHPRTMPAMVSLGLAHPQSACPCRWRKCLWEG